MFKFWFMTTSVVLALSAGWLLAVSDSAQGQTVAPPPPRWVFEPPPAQDPIDRQFQEVATLAVKVGEDYEVCWYNPVTRPSGSKQVEETALQIAHRRYRVEGGPLEVSEVRQFADWVPKKDSTGAVIPKSYCATLKGVSQPGHWVTEAQICRTPYVSDEASCSAWMSSIQRYTPSGGGGMLDTRPRGWWLYALGDLPPVVSGECKVAPNTIAIFTTRPAYGKKADGTLDRTKIVGRAPVGTPCNCDDFVGDHYSVAGQKTSTGAVFPMPSQNGTGGAYAFCVRSPQ